MKFRVIAAGAAVLAAFATTATAQNAAQESAPPANTATSPDVNLTPRRIVFGPNDRGVKEVTVFNRSNATATYNIAVVDEVMTPDGAIVPPEKAPEAEKARFKSATAWIRFSPRQVMLGPQEAQTVRIQARKPADLPAGEYRTHFSVTAVPSADAGTDIASAATGQESKSLQIKLTPVYGIMIPVIVRTADLPAQASISNVKLVESGSHKALQFALNRSGGRSLYGGVEAFLLGSGSPKSLGQTKGVGVYSEIDTRKMGLAIDADAPAVTHGSKVRIVYTDDELKPGTVLAETEVTLP